MIRHGLVFVLALSLLFNVFFLAGYLQARQAGAAAADPEVGLVANELDLDDAQRKVFTELRAGLREDEADLRTAMTIVQESLVAELGKATPDHEKVADFLDRRAELQRERRQLASDRFSAFVNILNPEQRRRLSARMERGDRRRGGDRSHRQLMERFDADGDGQLDESERAEAQEFMDARRRERAERMKAFDKDGDGRLNSEERAALREAFGSRGHRRPGDFGGHDPRSRRRPGERAPAPPQDKP